MDQDVPFERIGGYRILRRLATGGTSDVLLARAEGPHGFERTVVLKLLLQQFRRDAPMEKMFAREAAAYARLSHPAIVKLYDFFSAEGQLVMVLEFIDGLPLNRFRAMLRKNGEQIDDRAAIFIASRVFASLAAAHGARDPESGEFAPVIHRDVNPSNILIPWDGHVKLADFGIAKVAGVTSDTQAGFIKGTYGYMAPEQVRGEPVTIRTDVYAASLLLWELLARRKAIQRGALPELEVLRAMAEPSLPSLDVLRPDLPQRLRDALARGLEPSPDARSVTAEEMLIVLRESVTSNEGRNVLAEALARVRPEVEAARSGPPPAMSADITSKVTAQPAGPVVPPSFLAASAPVVISPPSPAAVALAAPAAPPRPTPRKTPEATGPRTASSSGLTAPISGAVLGRVVPPSTRGATGKGTGGRSAVTLALGSLREEALGAYSAVASPGRPISEERTSRPQFMAAPAAAPPPDPGPASEAALLSAVVDAGPPPEPPTATDLPALVDDLPALAADLPAVANGGRKNGRGTSQAMDAAPEAPAEAQPLVGQPVVNVSDNPPKPEEDSPPFVAPPAAPTPIINVGVLVEGTAGNAADEASAPATEPMPSDEVAALPMSLAATLAADTAPPGAVYSAPPPLHLGVMLAATLPSVQSPSVNPPPPTPSAVLTPLPPLPVAARPSKTTYVLLASLAVVAVAVVAGVFFFAQGAEAPAGKIAAIEHAPKPGPAAPVVAASDSATTASAIAASSSAPAVTASESAAPPASAAPAVSAAPVVVPSAGVVLPSTAAAPAASVTATPTASAPPPASAEPLATASPSPSASGEPAVEPTPVPSLAAGDGQIVTPPQAAGHRVFVDGRYAGDSPGPVVIHCGQHTVKIGSGGVPHTVDVPCGGEISVSPH